MTLTLCSIIDLLDITKSYTKNKSASKAYVQKTFSEKPIKQARLHDYDRTEMLSRSLDLIVIKNTKIILTNLGLKTLELYKKQMPDFHEFFIKEVLFNSKITQKILDAFSNFSKDDDKRSYPTNKVYGIFKVHNLLPILYEVGLLEKKHSMVLINSKYLELISHGRILTQEQLEAQLKNQKIIGDLAEKIVLDSERKKLSDDNCIDESKKVEQISKKHTNAGYDIMSFAKDNDGIVHKIYIEVKGTSRIEFDFYMSANELKKAQEYGEKYWIYFVSGIDIKTGNWQKITPIQNPSEAIFNDSKYTVEAEKYHITQKN